ncbi:MAG: hypothetical protein V4534_05620 [Myxococcota bacterium]
MEFLYVWSVLFRWIICVSFSERSGAGAAQQALQSIAKSVASATAIKTIVEKREAGFLIQPKQKALGSAVREHREQTEALNQFGGIRNS